MDRRSGLGFETITYDESFAALSDEWDHLVRAMPYPSPFLLHGWLFQWWRHFGAGQQLRVYAAFRRGELVAALPLFARRRVGVRVAEFLGSYESALADVLLARNEDPEVARQLADYATRSDVDLFDLFGVRAGSRLMAVAGPGARQIARVEAPVLDTSAGWETVYRTRLSSNMKALHRRRRRQLDELGEVSIGYARDSEDLQRHLDDAFRLHRLRWRDRPDHSTFGTAVGMRFHRAVLNALATDDVARIVTLRLDGHAIAFHYYFVLCDAMYVHRLAFDPALSRFSPGLVCTLAAIEAACAEGVRRIEFLGGAERYKTELADHFEPLYQLLGPARTIPARALLAARIASIDIQLRVKRTKALYRLYYEGIATARRALGALRQTPKRMKLGDRDERDRSGGVER